jgi:hypothetical protein
MALKSWTERYPKTGLARYYINAYNVHKDWEGDPITVCVHEIWQSYGGPEEGGWWYEAGRPVATHFVFSKKSAIKRCIELAKEFEVADQETIYDSRGLTAYDITFRDGYGQPYPSERPYYC